MLHMVEGFDGRRIVPNPDNQIPDRQTHINGTETVALEFSKRNDLLPLSLTEIKILQLRARGMAAKEIAKALGSKEQTVKKQNIDIDQKLDEGRKTFRHRALRSILIGVEKGIIDPDLVLKDVGLDVSFIEQLKPRQKAIIKCMYENRSISRSLIAEKLFLSPNTVRNHVRSIRMLALARAKKGINIIPIVIAYGEAQRQGKV